MVMNINSKEQCKELKRRILETLRVSGFDTNKIKTKPNQFPEDDNQIFHGLCKAVLSRQTDWDKVVCALPIIKQEMFDLGVIDHVLGMGEKDFDKRWHERLKGKTEVSFLRRKLQDCRKNAKAFQKIRQKHHSVREFIRNYLDDAEYDDTKKCYIWPEDGDLIKCFIKSQEGSNIYKLSGVGLPICCEFFNNIGIDELKPDEHIIIVLISIGVAGTKSRGPEEIRRKGATGKEDAKEIRKIGITIAETLEDPRKYVDSLLWNFGRQICRKNEPQCDLCQVKPVFCKGCKNLSKGLEIETIPKVKQNEFLKAAIRNDPIAAAHTMKQTGLSRSEACKGMKKACLEPDEIEEILKKVYDSRLDGK